MDLTGFQMLVYKENGFWIPLNHLTGLQMPVDIIHRISKAG